MAKIKSEDIFDKSLETTIEKLVKAEQNLLDVTKQLTESAKQLKTAYDATGIKNLTELNEQYEAQMKASYTVEKNNIEIQKQKEKLQQEQIRTTKLKNSEVEKEAKLAAKNANEAAKLASAYQKESAQLTKLRSAAKDVALTHGLMSKEFKKAQAEVQALDSKLKKVDAALGQNQRNVGNYKQAWSGVAGVLGQFGLAIGGAQIAMAAFKKGITSSQSATDSFAVVMQSTNAVVTKFFQNIGTGDWSNFWGGLEQARKAGEAFAKSQDDLFEGSKSLQILESETNRAVAELEHTRMNASLSNEKRMEAALAIQQKEKELEEAKKAEAIKSYESQRYRIIGLTGLSEEQFVVFLRNYRKEEGLRDQALLSLEQEQILRARIEKEAVTGSFVFENGYAKQVKSVEGVKKAEEDLSNFLAARPEIINNYLSVYAKYNKTTDDMVTGTIDAYTKMTDVETEYFDATKRNAKQLAAFQKELNDKKVEAKVSSPISPDKLPDLAPYYDKLIAKQNEWLDATLESMDDEIQEGIKKEVDYNNERVRQAEEAEQKLQELYRETAQMRNDLNMQGVELAATIFDAAFEVRLEKLRQESEAITEEYDKRLSNERLTEEQRDAIEAQRDAKLNANRQKQREIEKKQFLFSQAFKVAEVVMNTNLALGYLALKLAEVKAAAALNPLLVPSIAIVGSQIAMAKISGALSVAAILAQSIPKLDKGSDSTPSTFWAGESRTEILTDKKGRSMMVDKPTLFSGKEWAGSKLIGGAETERLLRREDRMMITHAINGKKSDGNLMMISALKKINRSIEKQNMSVRVNATPDIKTTVWYQKQRN